MIKTIASLVLVATLAACGKSDAGSKADVDPCEAGYTWHKSEGRCYKAHDARLVKKAKCKPGDTDKVLLPNGHTDHRECRFVK